MKKHGRLGMAVRIGITALFATVLSVNIFSSLLNSFDIDRSLRLFGHAVLTVEGGSMEPELSPGDLVIAERTDYDTLKIGDDVVFVGADGLVTHRIIGWASDGFITRGIANDTEDTLPMRREDFCARATGVVPALGKYLEALASPVIFLCTSALVLLSYLSLYLLRRYGTFKADGLWRRLPALSLGVLAAMSLPMAIPFMTDAKYTTEVSLHETAVASPLYFSSNYLSSGNGNTYNIQGWPGEEYAIALQIRNYDNSLLFNDENTSLRYGLGIKMTEGADVASVTMAPGTGADSVDTFAYPSDWGSNGITPLGAYEIAGGEKRTGSFVFTVKPTAGTLSANTRVSFEIYASTDETHSYLVELKGSFTLKVAEKTEFISQREFADKGAMATLSITTNLVQGSENNLVAFVWNTDEMYLNEYERTAFNIITKNPSYYNREAGVLYMDLQAYAKINLEFFKKTDESLDDEFNTHFRVEIVDSLDPSDRPALDLSSSSEEIT